MRGHEAVWLTDNETTTETRTLSIFPVLPTVGTQIITDACERARLVLDVHHPRLLVLRAEARPRHRRTTSPSPSVVTDGVDNASTATVTEVREAIARFQNRGWRILFIGANQDAMATASHMGISGARALTYDTGRMQAAFRSVSENVTAYRASGQDTFTTAQRTVSMNPSS